VEASGEVRLAGWARGVLVAAFLPLAVGALGLAPISGGLTLPFAAAFLWVCWWCGTQGADPPARPGPFVLLTGCTVPAVVWATVLLEGALT
jgi:hypothetical protein